MQTKPTTVFLFEFVTGGGFFTVADRPLPEGSLLLEGAAMWRAIYDDLACLPNVRVVTTQDSRLPESGLPNVLSFGDDVLQRFSSHAEEADFCLVIAPEFDQHLLRLVALLEDQRVPHLGPDSVFIKIASDKHATCTLLAAHDVPVPSAVLIDAGRCMPDDFPLPAVLKVNDGAGSMCKIVTEHDTKSQPNVMRLEQQLVGLSCSVSFLCRKGRPPIACPPMKQILSSDNNLTYLGGKRIMDSATCLRATKLASRAIEAMPPTSGYVGVDLLLGSAASGKDDYVIEVNPRLTTSYIGLRQIAKSNLAATMLEIAQDPRHAAESVVLWSDETVAFTVDGTIQ